MAEGAGGTHGHGVWATQGVYHGTLCANPAPKPPLAPSPCTLKRTARRCLPSQCLHCWSPHLPPILAGLAACLKAPWHSRQSMQSQPGRQQHQHQHQHQHRYQQLQQKQGEQGVGSPRRR